MSGYLRHSVRAWTRSRLFDEPPKMATLIEQATRIVAEIENEAFKLAAGLLSERSDCLFQPGPASACSVNSERRT